MQIEPTTVNNTLSVVGGVAISLAAVLGLGNLLLAFYQRYVGRKDKASEIHETNRGKELDATGNFQDRLVKRVEHLEEELSKMRDEQLSQVRINERLMVENENLKKENARQELEIHALQATVIRLEGEIKELRK